MPEARPDTGLPLLPEFTADRRLKVLREIAQGATPEAAAEAAQTTPFAVRCLLAGLAMGELEARRQGWVLMRPRPESS